MLKSELQTYAAPVLDEDFTNIVVSAVRYALPRHSYMPSLTRDYVWRYWKLLKKHHWCILRDIREYYRDELNWWKNHPEIKQQMDEDDLNAWVAFYNRLIQREDTHFAEGERHQHTPLEYVGEQ
jgi:hypothetical protein